MRSLAGIALSGLLVACGVPAEDQPRNLGADAAPFQSIAPASKAPAGATRALLYLINDGVLVAVPRRVEASTPEALLASLLAGPVGREQEAGLGSAVPRGAQVDELAQPGGLLKITLPPVDTTSSGRTDEVLGLGQLVLTLTSLREVRAVQFLRDGKTLAVPRADGSLTPRPVTRSDYVPLL